MKRYRVALAGYYGFGNFGDELLAEAAIAALLRCGVDRERIVLLSAAPEESKQKFGVDSVNRWKMSHVLKTLSQSETLLLGGGGLFQDSSSLLSCFYYWGLVRAARFCGAVPWALGQSVGPLSTRMGRRLTRDALSKCSVVQVRDAASEALCASLGLSVETGDDLALSLADFFAKPTDNDKPPTPGKKLLVNLRPTAGGFAERLAAAIPPDTALIGVALSDEDERLMNRLAKLDKNGVLPLTRIERIATMSDALRVFGELDGAAAVGMRLHFVVLAAMAGVPVVAAPYDPKVEGFSIKYDIPMWRGGELPQPRPASFSDDFSVQRVRDGIDGLCRRVLE